MYNIFVYAAYFVYFVYAGPLLIIVNCVCAKKNMHLIDCTFVS